MTSTPAVEHLTDGWERAIPHTDSLCRTFVYHWAEQNAAFAAAAGGVVARTDRFVVADHGHETGFFNAVVLLTPPRDWDELLDELDQYVAGGTGNLMLWSLWPTPDLRGPGWSLMGHPPLLLRPPAELAPVSPPAPEPHVVRTAAELAIWEDVAVQAYPLPAPDGGPALLGPALLADERACERINVAAPARSARPSAARPSDERLTFRISHDDAGAPVSVSAHFVEHGLASLAFGATLPIARGRGHWARHARARLRARPDLWHAGIFSDFSRPLAEAIGFVPIIRFTLWFHSRSDEEQS